MSDGDLRRIATFVTEDSAEEGTTLMREGDYATELVAIEEGTADVIRGDRRLATLGPGDVFGESGVLEAELRNASVVATSPMRMVKLTTWEIKRLTPGDGRAAARGRRGAPGRGRDARWRLEHARRDHVAGEGPADR